MNSLLSRSYGASFWVRECSCVVLSPGRGVSADSQRWGAVGLPHSPVPSSALGTAQQLPPCSLYSARKNESASLVLQYHGLHSSANVQRHPPGQVCVEATLSVPVPCPVFQTAVAALLLQDASRHSQQSQPCGGVSFLGESYLVLYLRACSDSMVHVVGYIVPFVGWTIQI